MIKTPKLSVMRLITILCFVFVCSFGYSQQTSFFRFEQGLAFTPHETNKKEFSKMKSFDKNKLVYGGTYGMLFGNFTFIELSPMVGYKVHPYLIVGTGFSYIYFQERFANGFVLRDNIWGGRIFGRIQPKSAFFLHAEYESLNRNYYNFLLDQETRIWWYSPLIGAGYNQALSDKVSMSTYGLYAVNYDDPRSPYYGSPFVLRIGIISN